MSDIVDVSTTDFQDQVLNDLDEIKGSLSDEENETDEEYQKKVLGTLRSLEKSVQALNDDSIVLSRYTSNNGVRLNLNQNETFSIQSSSGWRIECFTVSNIEKFYIQPSDSNKTYYCVLCNRSSLNAENNIPCKAVFQFNTSEPYEVLNYSNARYLLISQNTTSNFPISVYYLKSENPSAPEQGTIEQIDYSEPLDTLIQISTFQGYASALLIGVLLFLIFVKGVRK